MGARYTPVSHVKPWNEMTEGEQLVAWDECDKAQRIWWNSRPYRITQRFDREPQTSVYDTWKDAKAAFLTICKMGDRTLIDYNYITLCRVGRKRIRAVCQVEHYLPTGPKVLQIVLEREWIGGVVIPA